jgi:hypothetical protein
MEGGCRIENGTPLRASKDCQLNGIHVSTSASIQNLCLLGLKHVQKTFKMQRVRQ